MTHWYAIDDLNLLKTPLCIQYRGNIYSLFSRKSEATVSYVIENIKEMFLCYWELMGHEKWNYNMEITITIYVSKELNNNNNVIEYLNLLHALLYM